MDQTKLDTPAPARIVTGKNKIGLVLAGLLGLSDMAFPFVPAPEGGEAGPPEPVIIAGAILGLITVIGVVYAWRTGSRVAARITAGARILSILSALPAFFVPGVPAPLVALVGFTVVITVVAIVLMLAKPPAVPR